MGRPTIERLGDLLDRDLSGWLAAPSVPVEDAA
jgi:hypothetical protein